MRFPVILLLLTLVAPVWGDETLLILGDSLSAGYGVRPGEGWVDLLAQRLTQRGFTYRMINASVSGETSAGGLSRLEPLLTRHRPKILILELGANDGLRGLSLEALKLNLGTAIARARQSDTRVLLLGMEIPPNYGPRYAKRFSAIYGELAREQQLPPAPFLLEKVALDPAMMQADNLHPNAAGQTLMLETVWPALLPLLH